MVSLDIFQEPPLLILAFDLGIFRTQQHLSNTLSLLKPDRLGIARHRAVAGRAERRSNQAFTFGNLAWFTPYRRSVSPEYLTINSAWEFLYGEVEQVAGVALPRERISVVFYEEGA